MTKSDAEFARPSSSTPALVAAGGALIALAVHAYLLKSHYDLRYGEVTGKLICDISSKFSCSATSASKWSEFLGVPMALWGALANLAYLVLFAWDFITDRDGQHANRTGLLVTGGVLGLGSVVMAIISFTAIDAICPFCFATYVLSIATLVGAWFAYKPGLKFSLKPSFLGLTAAFAVAAFITNDQARSAYAGPGGDAMANAAVQEWTQATPVEIPETDPLAKGPSRDKAKLTLVEFADFRCIHCKLASAPIKAFLASHADVRLEYYSWPLDGECNTSIQQSNGASCLLARVVWCARKKGDKGWEAHEEVFERFEEWRSTEVIRSSIEGIATKIGVDPKELVTCSDSQEAKTAIEAQARLGTNLNIRGTPAIYGNGKAIPAGSSIPVLNKIYQAL